MSLATTAAAQSTSAAGSASGAGSSNSGNALSSLSGNFQDFLKLLMTQLQNQDPTSPLDTNQFTSQLVQFASVEQQINTNSSLTSLIQLTQSGEMIQSGSLLGRKVEVASDHVPLQNGTGAIRFTADEAGPVEIGIYADSGAKLRDVTVQATRGVNTWTWDGTNANGNGLADGSYRAAVEVPTADGKSTQGLAFTVIGTATGVHSSGSTLKLDLGTHSVDFTTVRSLVN